MQAHKIKLVQESFEKIAALGPKASEIFYAELFAIDPASCGAEHYTYVGNALLRMLRKVLGPEFTPELCEAWTEAFRAIARMMKEAAYGRSRLWPA